MKIGLSIILILISKLGCAEPVLVQTWFGNQIKSGEIVIVKSEKKIYFFLDDGEALSYDVAVGKAKTPSKSGEFIIERKAINPTWYPPDNIRFENPKNILPKIIPPGPKNPLGTRALYLSGGLVRIHGTNKESSVGKAVSHGCFRMRKDDIIDLYDRVTIGTKVYVFK